MKRKEFISLELGTTYAIPHYRVIDGQGIRKVTDVLRDEFNEGKSIDSEDKAYQQITFVRGDKTDNGTVIPRVDGITHEQLLGVMIADLQHKQTLVPSREGAIAITKLQEALMWLEERQRERESRNVAGTYKQ